ncbi:hypothetical protein X975_16195, partial [Stegodyphus mimosarum]
PEGLVKILSHLKLLDRKGNSPHLVNHALPWVRSDYYVGASFVFPNWLVVSFYSRFAASHVNLPLCKSNYYVAGSCVRVFCFPPA